MILFKGQRIWLSLEIGSRKLTRDIEVTLITDYESAIKYRYYHEPTQMEYHFYVNR